MELHSAEKMVIENDGNNRQMMIDSNRIRFSSQTFAPWLLLAHVAQQIKILSLHQEQHQFRCQVARRKTSRERTSTHNSSESSGSKHRWLEKIEIKLIFVLLNAILRIVHEIKEQRIDLLCKGRSWETSIKPKSHCTLKEHHHRLCSARLRLDGKLLKTYLESIFVCLSTHKVGNRLHCAAGNQAESRLSIVVFKWFLVLIPLFAKKAKHCPRSRPLFA